VLPSILRLGRCGRCGTGIGRWALAIEVATGVVFGLLAWQLHDRAATALPPALAFGAGAVAISAVDLGFSRIPTRFVYLTALAVALAGVPLLVDEPRAALGAAVGGGACLVLLGTVHLISPRMLGFGDVRLGALMGAVVGGLGWTSTEPILDPLSFVVTALFVAGVVGSLAGFALLAVRRRSIAYPFGPCLAIGGIVALLL
jgi:leader peptidase (prepilin peptidase)/N-methyltransferase